MGRVYCEIIIHERYINKVKIINSIANAIESCHNFYTSCKYQNVFKTPVTQEVIEYRSSAPKMGNLMPEKLIVYEIWNLINGKKEVSHFRTLSLIKNKPWPLLRFYEFWSNLLKFNLAKYLTLKQSWKLILAVKMNILFIETNFEKKKSFGKF